MTLTAPASTAVPYDSGRLSNLIALLSDELRASQPGAWASRFTRQGIMVSLSRREDGCRVCRLWSEDRPRGVSQWDRWHASVRLYQQHLGIARWQSMPPPSVSTGIAAWFLEPKVTP